MKYAVRSEPTNGAAVMIALLRHGSGVPFYRLEGMEASLGIPLPSLTQWLLKQTCYRATMLLS
jgi:hypothetical protein